MENSAIKPDDPAVLLVHKHKLIYVLARALLEKLGGEDPFLDVQQAVSQASEALDVFAATIKEFPEVLEYVLPAETTLQARGSAPLWVWLFPRVLTLLGQANCESLSGRIERLFSVSFQAVSQSPKLWNMSSMFFIYFKECVTSMSDSLAVSNHDLTFIAALLEYIRDHNLRSEVQSTSAVLPSVNMEWASLFMNEDETCSEFVAGCTYTLRNVSRCISHGKILLSILLGISAEAVLLHRATPAFSDYIGWMLDSFISLDELERRRLSISTIQNQTATVGWAFCAVKTLLSSLQEFISPAILQKGYISLAGLCVDLFAKLEDLSDLSFQYTLNSGILNLASICGQEDTVKRRVLAQLVPLIQEAVTRESIQTAMGNDFLVSSPSKLMCNLTERNLESSVSVESSMWRDFSCNEFQWLRRRL